jgi:hypothetical protein
MRAAEPTPDVLFDDEATRPFLFKIAQQKNIPVGIVIEAIEAGLSKHEIETASNDRLYALVRRPRRQKPESVIAAPVKKYEPIRR